MKSPYVLAAECYRKWDNEKQFIPDVEYYLRNGVVIATPVLFGMAQVVELEDGAKAWFVRVAVGELHRLLCSLPAYLPKICFCRKGDNRLRIYSYDRLLMKAKLWATH